MPDHNPERFGEHERVEEAKFYPAAEPAPVDPGQLPSSYGRNRLVLLPVDPYLLYAYWQLAADLPPTAGSRSILRFYQTPGRPFDVDVELGAGNWYVHLWSPDKTYEAELGLRAEDGTFVSLAHSNLIHTAASVPAPAKGAEAPPPAGDSPEPIVHDLTAPGNSSPSPLAAEPADTSAEPAIAMFVAEVEGSAPIPPPPVAASQPSAPSLPAQAGRSSGQSKNAPRVNLDEVFAVGDTEFGLRPQPVIYTDSPATGGANPSRQNSAPLEALQQEDREYDRYDFDEPIFAAMIPGAPVPFDLGDLEEMDLTDYSEQRFTPGISSEGGPLGD